jgi:hypothetical protein
VAEETLSRRIVASVLSALKSEGHILVERGGQDAVVRDLEALLVVPLPRLVARAARAPVSGEVTSTFGDEATDEAVEELVAVLREAIVESDHVEDVFADDRELERSIFRSLRDELLEAFHTSDDAVERVPISVRLDTLGYVAATAARRADEAVVRGALERAARQADGELEGFEPASRVALFALPSEDPDLRLEVEEAVADELMSLVTEGAVALPTVDRRIPLGRALNPLEWRAARTMIDAVAKRLLAATGVPSSWRPDGADAIRLSFTPLSEKDADLVEEIAAAFQRDVAALVGPAPPPPSEPAPKSTRPVSSRRPSEDPPPRSVRPTRAAAAKSDPPEPAPTSARRRPTTGGATKKAATKVVEEKAPVSRRPKTPPPKRGS